MTERIERDKAEARLRVTVTIRCGMRDRVWRLELGFVGQRGMGLN